MKQLKVIIYGSKGRMGQNLVRCTKENPALELVGTIDAGESLDAIASCDAVIDFTHADATIHALRKCVELGKIIVIGTTGHSNDVRQAITEASSKIVPSAGVSEGPEGPVTRMGAILATSMFALLPPVPGEVKTIP